jgi:hypothetical protein
MRQHTFNLFDFAVFSNTSHITEHPHIMSIGDCRIAMTEGAHYEGALP